MPTPSSGEFRFTDIENEFGQADTRSIGAYVNTWDYGDYEAPLDRGPNGGTSSPTVKSNVRFSDFYNRELNVVADFYNNSIGGSVEYRKNAKNRYNDHAYVVGPAGEGYGNGSKTRPANTGSKRVIISVNKIIGSEKTVHSMAGMTGEQKVALKTGSNWTAGTELFIHVGNNAYISGAGGDGGNGQTGSGERGDNATSALGIQWEGTVVTVINNGAITHGYVGGGGGGGAWAEREEWWEGPTKSIRGSGGGGGAGIPAGYRGSGEANGESATFYEKGEGGNGDCNTGEEYTVCGGDGGDGGESSLPNGESGEEGSTGGETENTNRGEGGHAGEGLGAAIRKSSGSISWTFGTGHVTSRVKGAGKNGSGESPTGVL